MCRLEQVTFRTINVAQQQRPQGGKFASYLPFLPFGQGRQHTFSHFDPHPQKRQHGGFGINFGEQASEGGGGQLLQFFERKLKATLVT
jgi:hypothetical protein